MDIIPDFDSTRGIVLSAEESKKNRLKAGLCRTCSKKLFDIKRSKFNPLKVTKVPLTDKNAIKGRCRICDPPKDSVADNSRRSRNRKTVHDVKQVVNGPKTNRFNKSTPTVNFRAKKKKDSDDVSLKTSSNSKFRRPPPRSEQRRSSGSDEVPQRKIVDDDRRASAEDYDFAEEDEYIPKGSSSNSIEKSVARRSDSELPSNNYATDNQDQYLSRPKSYNGTRNKKVAQSIKKSPPRMASMDEFEQYDPSCYGGHDDFDDVHQSFFSDRKDPTEAEKFDDSEQHLDEVHDVIAALFGETRAQYQRMLCNKLLSFARNANAVVEIVLGGGLTATHSLMTGENSMDTPLQEVACRLMKVLCPTADDNMLQQIPLIETITCLMMVHTSLNLQESCITILKELSDRSDTFKGLIDDSGGIDIVLSALKQYESPVIRKDGQILVTNLSRYIDSTASR